jgi:FdhD protein
LLLPNSAAPHRRLRWRTTGPVEAGERAIAEETPVAIVHDGSTTAVMMATPADLEDFALGFSLSEGVIDTLADVRDLDVAVSELGVEVRLWLEPGHTERLAARRRHLAGPTGCGLCGIDSLAEAVRALPRVDARLQVTPATLLEAMDSLSAAQALGAETRAVHASALCSAGAPLLVREDVGRHNALDKLLGAVRREGREPGESILLLTSRVSVEMVQKAAVLGAPVICAVSAPTALAIRTAEACGLTLVGVCRADGFEVFTHADRIALPATESAA